MSDPAPFPRYENRRLTDLCHRIERCTLRLPGVCVGHSVGGCEPAHSNQSIHGKSGARKADDCWVAAGCHPCHAELDQGRKFSQDEKARYWMAGHVLTLAEFFRRGWLKVAA